MLDVKDTFLNIAPKTGNIRCPFDDVLMVLYGEFQRGHVLQMIAHFFHNTIDGREQILYVYRTGDFVGGLNLLVASNYLYMAQALQKAEILVIPKSAFDRHMYNNPSVLRVILEQSFHRIRYAEDLISRLSKNTATLKVAALLLRLKNDIGVEVEQGMMLYLTMNREELGSYAGLTRESMTRTLNEFREDGYVDWVDPQTILIRDSDALLALLET